MFKNLYSASCINKLSLIQQMNAPELELISPLGGKIETNPPEVAAFVRDPKFLLFIEIGILIYIVFDVHGLSAHLGYVGTLIYWHYAAYVTVAYCVIFTLAFGYLNRQFRSIPAYLPLILFLSTWPAVASNRWVATLLTDVQFPDFLTYVKQTSVSAVGVTSLGFLLFEFAKLETPYQRENELQAHAPDENAADRPSIILSGRKISTDDLIYVKSAGHYLEILTSDGKLETLYGKLSELDQKVSDSIGVSPHRSYWIPAHAIQKLDREGRKSYLLLKNGERIPISAAKKKGVNDWLLDNIPSALK